MSCRGHVLFVLENLPIAEDQRARKQLDSLLADGYEVTVVSPKDLTDARYARVPGVRLRTYPEAARAWGPGRIPPRVRLVLGVGHRLLARHPSLPTDRRRAAMPATGHRPRDRMDPPTPRGQGPRRSARPDARAVRREVRSGPRSRRCRRARLDRATQPSARRPRDHREPLPVASGVLVDRRPLARVDRAQWPGARRGPGRAPRPVVASVSRSSDLLDREDGATGSRRPRRLGDRRVVRTTTPARRGGRDRGRRRVSG